MIQPKKSLGQHFLTNPQYCTRILELADISKGDTVLEIGPGTGYLTSFLLQYSARVTALEFDRDMIALLGEKFAGEINNTPPTLQLEQANVLNCDWAQLLSRLSGSSRSGDTGLPGSLPKIIGNLPYNISTRILEYATGYKIHFQSFTFMSQKEVAERILAGPGSPDYGYFSLLMEFHFHRMPGFDVPPGVFSPPPRVMSHVMQLRPRFVETESPARLIKIIKCAFRQRRKTLYNNLKPLFRDSKELSRVFEEAGIPEKTRPQQINLEQFLAVSDSCSRMLSFQA